MIFDSKALGLSAIRVSWLFLLIPSWVFAQKDEAFAELTSEALVYGQQTTFFSPILNERVSLNISLPQSFSQASADHTYPVLFIPGGHGREFFHTLTGLVKHLAQIERMPETIVVGLIEGSPSPKVYCHGMWGTLESLGPYGDVTTYLQHFREELIPYLERTYRAAPFRMVIGVSGSSLFPLHTFVNAPDLFQAHLYLTAFDMIGMGEEAGKSYITHMAESIVDRKGPKTYLYVGTASSDLKDSTDYSKNLEQLSQLMTPLIQAKFAFKSDVFAQETHYGVFNKAVLAALEWIFPQEQWQVPYRSFAEKPDKTMETMDAYYAALSQAYGFRILPRAERWNSPNSLTRLWRYLDQNERHQEALAVAERLATYRPRSVDARNLLVKSRQNTGDLPGAITAMETAVRLAKISADTQLSELETQLATLRTALRKDHQ